MTFKFKPSSTCRALPAAASGLCLALCLATGSAQAVLVTTYNTGAAGPGPTPTTLPGGAIDPHYVLITSPGGGLIGPAAVLAPPPSSWLGSGPNSEWLEPLPNGQPPAFTNYYQTTFNLTGFDKNTAVLVGEWATYLPSPNTNIYLNGVSLIAPSVGGFAAPATFNAWASFSGSGPVFSSALTAGVNTLAFAVNASPAVSLTGLRVQYHVDAQPVPEPSTYALFGLGLAAVGLARARRLAAAAGQPA